jgi:ribosomal protein L11 methylase PrmA
LERAWKQKFAMEGEFLSKVLALNAIPKYITHASVTETESTQEEFLHQLLDSETAKKFPLPRYQIIQVLEAVVRTCESSRRGIAERVYEELALGYHGSTQLPQEAFGTFTPGGIPIGFHANESTAFVQGGSTGFVTWEAGKCLAWYCASKADALQGMRILELGSGTGVTGIVICKHTSPAGYTFSDYHEATLEQSRRNCIVNGLTDLRYTFARLDLLSTETIDTDIIIGADILYDEELCRGLVVTLGSPNCRFSAAYIMSTIRTEATYTVFKSCLGDSGMEYEVLKNAKFSEWVIGAQKTDPSWSNFLKTTVNSFDPDIELVRIRKT